MNTEPTNPNTPIPEVQSGVPMSTPGGHIVLTQAQYEELRQAATSTGANPNTGASLATQPAQPAQPAQPKPWWKINWGLLLVACLLLSFLIPGFSGLAFPIVVFSVLAMLGFFRDTSTTPHSTGTKAAILIFKIIAAFLMSIGIGVVALIALFLLLLPATGTKGS